MKISFNCFNMNEAINFCVSDDENIVILNGAKIIANPKAVITSILRYTLGWSGEYYLPGFDGEEFNLKIELNGEVKVVKGAKLNIVNFD